MLSPDQQRVICTNERKCYLADYPTLGLIRSTYGEYAPAKFLVPHLFDLSEYSGCKGKLTESQLADLAVLLANEATGYKVSELMLFFFRFKGGRYGDFYGNVQPMKIIEAFREKFKAERNRFLDCYEAEQNAIKESQRKPITYEEYCKLKEHSINYQS